MVFRFFGIISLLSTFFFNVCTSQSIWPFRDENGNVVRGNITGTVGDYRASGTSTRFHAGVDFTSALTDLPGRNRSRAVYSMHAGTISIQNQDGCLNDYIRILTTEGNYVYYKHINVASFNPVTNQQVIPLANGNTVQVGTFLGMMVTDGGCEQHVHINDNTTGESSLVGNTNFINNFVNPFDDNQSPDFMYPFNANGNIVLEGDVNNIVEFRSNGHTYSTSTSLYSDERVISNINHKIIYEKVDILSRIRDRKILASGLDSNEGNNGMNSIYYEILDLSNNPVGNRITNINFNTVPALDRAPFVFDSRSIIGSVSRHIYILTGNPSTIPYDRFWNTRLRRGQNEDWSLANRGNKDARSISEAFYPDGQYKIRIGATDIRNQDGNASNLNIKIASILIDNFRPYVKEVIVRKNGSEGRLISRGLWEWNSTSGQLSLKHDQGDDAGITDAIWVKIITSEPVQNVRLNVPVVNGNDFFEVNQVVPNSNNTEFIAIINPIAASGDQTIRIQAEDYAGNPLQSNPALIPIRQPNGTWSAGVQPGIDGNHYFKTGSFVCTNSGNPGGRTASNSSTSSPCLYSDFSVSQSTLLVNEVVKFSPIASGSGVINYSWNFGSGAIPASSNSGGLQTVTYTTAGPKTVTLQICDATTNCKIAEKVNAVTVLGNGSSEITVDFSASPTVANVDQSIQLTANVSGASGPLNYWWHFDSGIKQGIPTDANPVISYTTPGNKSLSLTVTDAYGNVTKVKNNFLLITSNVYNVNPTIQGSCITVGADGMASFSAFVTGGNGPPYDSYLWDFGDGETSTMPIPLPHKYTKTGKYTVRLTVCDETSCGTTEAINCINVPWITDPNSLKPEFTVNNLPFPTVYSPYEVGLNTPVTFASTTEGGGSQIFLTYNWDFESHFLPGWGGNNSTESAVPATATTVGPHEVYYTVQGNKEVRLAVGTTGVGSILRDKIRPSVKVVSGLGSGRCFATLGNATISNTCWSASSPSQFAIPVTKSNCPVAKTEVLYWPTPGNAVVLPNNKLDFSAMGVPIPQFPLVADFSFAVYQYDGLNYNRIGYKRQRFTIYGPVLADAGADKQVCLGSSVTLGTTSINNLSYLWTSSNQTALSFLSSTTSPNPVFSGVQKGTYILSLKTTNTQTGCVSAVDNVTIVVDKPEVTPASFSPRIGESMLISGGVTSGFGNNIYGWSPATKISSASAASPSFSSSTEGDFSYQVTVTDQNGCQGSGQVFVNVSDAAGNVRGIPASFSRIIITWLDRSNNETGYLIRKSTGGNNNYVDYVTVGPNITSYEDTNVMKDVNYYYQVVTLFGANSKSSLEFSINTNVLAPFTFMPTTYDTYTRVGDFDNDLDLDIVSPFGANNSYIVWNTNGTFNSKQDMPQRNTYPGQFFDAVGDFDADDDLDIFDGRVLKNNNGVFTSVNWSTDLTRIRPLPCDINTDNYVDIAEVSKIRINLAGTTFNTAISSYPQAHINEGPGQLFGIADMNNDGFQDIISKSGEKTIVAIPNIGGNFANPILINEIGPIIGHIDIGDVNSDGLLDFASTGAGSNTTLYINQGNFSFNKLEFLQKRIDDWGILKFGDMDGDGDLDVFLSGNTYLYNNASRFKGVYKNDGGVFTPYYLFPQGGTSFIDWIDFDNDGDLDILTSNNGIFVNNLNSNKYKPNTKPIAPQNLCSSLTGNELTMSWNRASDAETPSAGLTYNIFVKQNGVFVMSSMANLQTGFRKVAQRGNVDQNISWTITLPGTGNIEWGVQAIDTQYIGSSFSKSSLPFMSTTATKTICSGEKSNFIATSPNVNPIFSWTVKSSTANIIGSSSGSGSILDQTLTNSSSVNSGTVTYLITEFFPSCYSVTFEAIVTVRPKPNTNISIGGPSTICSGEVVRLTAPSGTSYYWNNGSSNSYIDVTETGIYSVLTTNNFGCTQKSNDVQITVNPKPKIFLYPVGPVSICQGNSVTLTASPEYINNGSSVTLANQFFWSTGATGASINVSSPGVYTVFGYNIQNGCSFTKSIEVTSINPSFDILSYGDLCTNGSMTLYYSGPAYNSIIWSTGSTSNSITVYGAGNYSANANISGCLVVRSKYVDACNSDPCLMYSLNKPDEINSRRPIDPCALARRASDSDSGVITDESLLVDEPSVFPNPANNLVKVAIPYVSQRDIPIKLFDLTGRNILITSIRKGNYSTIFNIEDIPDGLYLIQLEIDNKPIRQKLEIVKKL
jgi:PKD repeat protein